MKILPWLQCRTLIWWCINQFESWQKLTNFISCFHFSSVFRTRKHVFSQYVIIYACTYIACNNVYSVYRKWRQHTLGLINKIFLWWNLFFHPSTIYLFIRFRHIWKMLKMSTKKSKNEVLILFVYIVWKYTPSLYSFCVYSIRNLS